jgi:glycosyltransferase involved in cell wall biosynthesis
MMFQCFRNQTYPKSRIEWIIVDDGTDKIRDLIQTANIPQIKYIEVEKKMALGEKRNFMHTHAKGSIIVYMDDDDYYPPERIEHAVERLTANPTALCAGSSEIYIYYKHIHKMYQAGPYGPNHSTAGTFAFRKELLEQTKYDDHAALAEEKHFLKNYTVPFVQLDPMKTILVFSHIQNTFDKRKLLENQNPQFFKESPKTVNDFIRETREAWIKKFFMEDIDELLANYRPGEPKMKPDVLVQMKKMEKEREKMVQNMPPPHMMNGPMNAPQIMMVRGDNQEHVALNPQEVVNLIQQQQAQIQSLVNQLSEKDRLIESMKKTIQSLKCSVAASIPPSTGSVVQEASKIEPMFVMDVSD